MSGGQVSLRRRAFSYVDAIVVLAIMAVLAGLAIPALQAAREAGYRTQCANNLKHIGQALSLYHDQKLRLPPSRLDNETVSWAWLILPYLDQEDIYKGWNDFSERPKGYEEFTSIPIPTFFCPSHRSPEPMVALYSVSETGCMNDNLVGTVGDYAASVGSSGWDGYIPAGFADVWTPDMFPAPNGAFQANLGVRFIEITDGLSTTLLVGEKHVPRSSQRYAPYDCSIYDGHNLTCHSRYAGVGFPIAGSGYPGVDLAFGSQHPHIVQFVFADGSVHQISAAVEPYTLGLLANRADGEEPTDFE